jgi:DNA-directed RNA polymerase subunit RPC12/RpoP
MEQTVQQAEAQVEYLCDRCGTPMEARKCKIICENCGAMRDCSDP